MENKKKPKEAVTETAVDLVIEVAEVDPVDDVAPVVEEVPVTEESPARVPTTAHTDPGGAGYKR